jgi:hypothetical protein
MPPDYTALPRPESDVSDSRAIDGKLTPRAPWRDSNPPKTPRYRDRRSDCGRAARR